MHYWLAKETRERREASGLTQHSIAQRLPKHGIPAYDSTISRWEQYETWPQPDALEGILAAYADLTDYSSPREFWLKAATRFASHEPEREATPAQRAMQAAQQAAQASQPDVDRSKTAPSAKHTRRKAR